MSLPVPASDATIIRRLRVRSAAPERASMVRRELESAPWPRVPGEEWVLVRTVSVRGPNGVIGERARAALAESLTSAVDGAGAGADGAQAIRFRDLPDLLAALCSDLATGRAAGLWYWQHWSDLFRLPAGEALRLLLGGQIAYLATLTQRLADLGALARVWRTLSPDQAAVLQTSLSVHVGLTLSDPPTTSAAVQPPQIPSPPPALCRRWATTLAGMECRDPRLRLAASLVALEWRPLWLWSGSAGRLDALGRVLAGLAMDEPGAGASLDPRSAAAQGLEPAPSASRSDSGSPPGQSTQGPAVRGGRPHPNQRNGTGGRKPDGPGQARLGAAHGERIPAPAQGAGGVDDSTQSLRSLPGDGADLDGLAAGSPLAGGRTPVVGWLGEGIGPNPGGRSSSRLQGHQGEALPSPPGGAAQIRSESPPAGAETNDATIRIDPAPDASVLAQPGDLETGSGGLFYLVNFLARPEARALWRGTPGVGDWDTLGGTGWAWLWGLGRLLGLDATDPLAHFFAERLGFADARSMGDLPPLEAGAALFALGARLYGTDEVWNPRLLEVPARLRHTPSHLDLDYPLDAVRLPVRRVALDLNPGWVSWLGRVVTFHYLDPWPPGVGRAWAHPGGRR